MRIEKQIINVDDNLIKIPVKRIKNLWKVLAIVFSIALLASFYFLLNKKQQAQNSISGEIAGKKIIEFLNTKTEEKIQYESYTDLGNVYEITVSYNGDSLPVYITKDGNYFVQGVIPI